MPAPYAAKTIMDRRNGPQSPRRYLVSEDDRTINPDAERETARRIGTTIIVGRGSSHAAPDSPPDVDADAIKAAAMVVAKPSARSIESNQVHATNPEELEFAGESISTKENTMTSTAATSNGITFKTKTIDGLSVLYREAGATQNPKLLLLGGFPASSHQFRLLIPHLAPHFHILVPDYPGFGNTDMPNPAQFSYTFDKLSDVVEGLLQATGFTQFGLFAQDYGGPIGFRILDRHPAWLEWLTLQNTNAYEEGFTAAWDGFRKALWLNRTPETEAPLLSFPQLDAIRSVYLHGHKNPEVISPDNWNMDFHYMERPNARRVQLDLFWDYRTNPQLYPTWQAFLRKRQPKTIIFWGQGDIFFTPAGGAAFLRDLPQAAMHRLDSGHFAIEDHHQYIAEKMLAFYTTYIAKETRNQCMG